MTGGFSRRQAALLCGGGVLATGLAPGASAQPAKPLLRRAIPHGGGETLPVVGVGTSEVFDLAAGDRVAPTAVVQALVAGGGSLIDTAPSYGEAETVVGDVVMATGLRPRVFIATKLEYYRPGQEGAEAQGCLQRLKTEKLDLLQLHNVRDPRQSLAGLNALKARGLCRYTGITTTFQNSYAAAEAIITREKPDFLEIDYAIDNREAEDRVLPAAASAGTAVLVALPFGRGRLFRPPLAKSCPTGRPSSIAPVGASSS